MTGLLVLAAVLALSLTGSRHVQARVSATVSLYVDATVAPPGVDTGVDVAAGQTLSMTASGRATYGDQGPAPGENCVGTPETDPDGQRYLNGVPCGTKRDSSATLPTANIGALIGRIGIGAWFLVGSSHSAPASATGRLFLVYNDNGYFNNTGGYSVTITKRVAWDGCKLYVCYTLP